MRSGQRCEPSHFSRDKHIGLSKFVQKVNIMKDDNALMGCLGWIAYLAIILVFGSILGGWALSIMWEWFVVPVFSLPSLGIAQAIGLSCVITLLVPRQSETNSGVKKSAFDIIIETSATTFLGPLMALGFGWVIYQFIR